MLGQRACKPDTTAGTIRTADLDDPGTLGSAEFHTHVGAEAQRTQIGTICALATERANDATAVLCEPRQRDGRPG